MPFASSPARIAAALAIAFGFAAPAASAQNLIERLVILTPADEITEPDVRAVLPLASGDRVGGDFYRPGRNLRDMMEDVERELIARALEHHRGHMTQTAADLGLERSHL